MKVLNGAPNNGAKLSGSQTESSSEPQIDQKLVEECESLMDSSCAFHREFYRIVQDHTQAVVLNELYYWTIAPRNRDKNGWFFCSLKRWRDDYRIKRDVLESAIEWLEKQKLVQIERRGFPLTISYRVDLLVLSNALKKIAKSPVCRNQQTDVSLRDSTNCQFAGFNTTSLRDSTSSLRDSTTFVPDSVQELRRPAMTPSARFEKLFLSEKKPTFID